MDFSSRQDSSLRRLLKIRRSEVSKLVITTTSSRVINNHDTPPPFTLYTFQLKHPNTTNPTEWTIQKRYSQCFTLFLRLRDTAWQWENFQHHELLGPLVKTLQKASGLDFPRKHAHQNTEAVIRERRRGLTNFMLSILAAYTDLDVLISGGMYGSTELCGVYTALERFLEIPLERKQMEMEMAQFVLILRDVKTTVSCCICLSDGPPSGDASLKELLRLRSEEINVTTKAEVISDPKSTASPHTQYIFTIEKEDSVQWTLWRRYSQCFEFYRRLRQGTHWEWTSISDQETFEPLVQLLEHAARSEFPRKHIRYDTPAIIRERCRKLGDFMLTVLTAYVYLEVLLSPMGCLQSILNSGENTPRMLFRDMQRFLEIPSWWNAIEQHINPDVEVPEQMGETIMAELSCGHAFHEDCIILWLQSNATCPVCRRAVK